LHFGTGKESKKMEVTRYAGDTWSSHRSRSGEPKTKSAELRDSGRTERGGKKRLSGKSHANVVQERQPCTSAGTLMAHPKTRKKQNWTRMGVEGKNRGTKTKC